MFRHLSYMIVSVMASLAFANYNQVRISDWTHYYVVSNQDGQRTLVSHTPEMICIGHGSICTYSKLDAVGVVNGYRFTNLSLDVVSTKEKFEEDMIKSGLGIVQRSEKNPLLK